MRLMNCGALILSVSKDERFARPSTSSGRASLLLSLLLALALVIIADAACSRESVRAAGETRLGYSRDAFERQRTLERGLRDAVSADEIRKGHAVLTHQPHMSGTDGARIVADYLARTLKGAGLDVEVLEYQAYLSFPKTIEVSIVAPIAQTVSVNEPPSPLDPDTQNRALGPAFVAYSGSGDVTAPAVYVNYGLPPDYAQLANQNVDVRGKVVIARYGKSHRAVKLHTAEKAGAAGILIYSDPADDGFVRGKTWPDGYWRTADQMQRGNGKYSWFWHGDPLTPGVAAVRDAVRQDPAAAPTLPRIPAAVLSWGEAQKILERLDGPPAPAQFRGGMPIEYHLGGGRTRVRIRVEMDNGLRTIRDVVAHVPGARQADREVILGTHHDAWTYGGVDPGTGTAVLLELGRVLGALGRGGWRPQRTITLAFWDAEEFGLIGSTEYAEDRKDALRERAVAYINTDLYTNGALDVGGTPSLRDLLIEIAQDIPDGGGTIYDSWPASSGGRMLKSLGSGADFVPFQDFVGIPTLSVEFNATGGYTYGAYHSNYDTRYFVEHVADPGFRRGAQLVRVLGTIAVRLSEAQILPFRFSHYAEKLAAYVTAAKTWGEADGGAMALDVAAQQVARIAEAAGTLEQLIDERLAAGRLPPAATLMRVNDALARLEQRLIDDGTPWYHHVVYGWNIYSLYDGQPLPRLAEAIRERDPGRVKLEIARIDAALDRMREGLVSVTQLLRQP